MKRFAILVLALAASLSSMAQTLQQGRNLFQQGQYAKAKPIMLKYLKQKPQDASRNYWYGECCMQTGEQEKALPYLELAAEKDVQNAFRALGDYYQWAKDYAQAVTWYNAYIDHLVAPGQLEKNRDLIYRYTAIADSLDALGRMLRTVSKVCFIDSIAIAKDQLFGNLTLGPMSGSVQSADTFFKDSSLEGEVFVTETGQSILYSCKGENGLFSIYKSFRSFGSWDAPTLISELDMGANLRYPFLMNDGTTVYFASDCSESVGGLDIFVSRINPATGKYFKPENIGAPFNSSANDYMLAIDEADGLGWFATDRGMSPDSVCLYIFIPESMNRYYSLESDSMELVLDAAALKSIAATQTDPEMVAKARQRLMALNYGQSGADDHSFSFIIDDLTTYHEADDFQNADARTMFTEWTGMKDEFRSKSTALDGMRTQYATSDPQERERMSASLLELEDQVLSLERRIAKMENDIRTVELNFLKR